MYPELERKMREIIWRRWTVEGYPTVEDRHPTIYTSEIYNELIEAGVPVPWGAMGELLIVWMSQGNIRTSAVGGSSEDKGLHGSMKIVAVYESLINSH